MGSYLAAAAGQLGLDWDILDASKAYAASWPVRAFYWRLCDKRPPRLARFGTELVDRCIATQRNVVLTTGQAPLERQQIERLRGLGVEVLIASTDDPWNPAQRAGWFLSEETGRQEGALHPLQQQPRRTRQGGRSGDPQHAQPGTGALGITPRVGSGSHPGRRQAPRRRQAQVLR